MSIKIDKEFQDLIPPLSKEEYTQLEANCVHDGIRDPIVVWEVPGGDDIIVDGHNRWNISAHHGGIRFNIVKMHFDNREQVKEWIIKNQLGRRNIPAYVRAELALLLKPQIAAKAKEQQIRKPVSQISVEQKPIDTQKEIAKAAGVSHDTIHKVEKIQEKASEEAKAALRRGEASINQVYSGIMADEHKDKRQQAERELREAKKRHEDFAEAKGNSIVSFTDAKQDKEDARLITSDFCKYFYDKGYGIELIATEIDNKGIDFLLSGATEREVRELKYHLNRWMKSIFHIQHVIEDWRGNEK